jgi:Protein of unknown function (DUF3422)
MTYPFPGTRAAGAQYFLIPAELLLLILTHIQPLSVRYFDQESPAKIAAMQAQMGFEGPKKTLCDLEEIILEQEKRNHEATWKTLAQLLEESSSDIDGFMAAVGAIKDRVTSIQHKFDQRVLEDDGTAKKQAESFYQGFVTMAELLWRTIYATEACNLGYDDFVASTVIDGRAIYFSNFRPYEKLGFTRTFFLDFCLSPYQRGRLVRRLCEIATYRMSCVSDFNLFQALQEGINTLNNEFNSRLSGKIGDPQEIGPIERALKSALSLYQRALQFDMFISEGVAGRGRAVESDWDRVKRQLSDIREGRLRGFATLEDFLNRGLAVHVLEMSRIADRYENLLTRIRDHMSTIRTDLTGIQALEITNFMATFKAIAQHTEKLTDKLTTLTTENVRLAQTLSSQTEELKKQSMEHTSQAREHTTLLKGADLLVWIGSTVYLAGLFDDLRPQPFEDWIQSYGWYAKAIERVALDVISGLLVARLYLLLTGRSILAGLRSIRTENKRQ